MKKIAAFVATIALLGTFGVSEASAAKLTKGAAVRALDRELRNGSYDMATTDIRCKRLTRKKMRCAFDGLTEKDVSTGNIDGHYGLAYVVKYRYGIDVRVVKFKKG